MGLSIMANLLFDFSNPRDDIHRSALFLLPQNKTALLRRQATISKDPWKLEPSRAVFGKIARAFASAAAPAR
jgi:hypothetical protein